MVCFAFCIIVDAADDLVFVSHGRNAIGDLAARIGRADSGR